MNEFEDKIRTDFQTEIEQIIKGWFKTDLEELDRQQLEEYKFVYSGDENARQRFDVLIAGREAIQHQINEMVTKTIILFGESLEHMEERGVMCISQDSLRASIIAYLDGVGMKLGKLEGAIVDPEYFA